MKDDDESNDRLKFAKASVIESKGTILKYYIYFTDTITSKLSISTQRE